MLFSEFGFLAEQGGVIYNKYSARAFTLFGTHYFTEQEQTTPNMTIQILKRVQWIVQHAWSRPLTKIANHSSTYDYLPQEIYSIEFHSQQPLHSFLHSRRQIGRLRES